jgi:hypothetical protein
MFLEYAVAMGPMAFVVLAFSAVFLQPVYHAGLLWVLLGIKNSCRKLGSCWVRNVFPKEHTVGLDRPSTYNDLPWAEEDLKATRKILISRVIWQPASSRDVRVLVYKLLRSILSATTRNTSVERSTLSFPSELYERSTYDHFRFLHATPDLAC